MNRPALIALGIVGLIVALAIDMPVHRWIASLSLKIEKKDYVQFLRSGGYFPMWLGLALAIALEDCRRAGHCSKASIQRGLELFSAVALAGILAELLKLIFRRERPKMSDGWYVFRSWSERTFDAGGLSMPSSHALLAFAGAATLARFFPAAAPVIWLFALGTATTRVLTGAHYVSDVYVAFLVGWIISTVINSLVQRRSNFVMPVVEQR